MFIKLVGTLSQSDFTVCAKLVPFGSKPDWVTAQVQPAAPRIAAFQSGVALLRFVTIKSKLYTQVSPEATGKKSSVSEVRVALAQTHFGKYGGRGHGFDIAYFL